jgi:hypothetical protein
MAVSCDPNDLIEEAKCFRCISGEANAWVMIYLLRNIADLEDMTPEELVKAAKCFECIPPGASQAVMVYLLCQILNAT